MPGLTARLAASLAAVLVAGCGADADTAEAGSTGPLETMIMGTGPVGGTYYPLGAAIAQLWNAEVDGLTVTTVATDASLDNLRGLDSGEFQLALAVGGAAADAAAGTGPFANEPLDFTLVGNLYPESVQIAASAQSQISSLDDLDGRRVAIGPAGSGTHALARDLLEAAGVVPSQIVEAGFGEAAVDLGAGGVDAAIGVLAVPDTAIGEAVAAAGVSLVPVPPDVSAALVAEDPSLSATEIPAGSYRGQDEAVPTVGTWAALYAMRDLDHGQVRALTAALYEQGAQVGNTAAASIDLTAATADRGDVDLHPGAAAYYAEQGLDVT